MSHHCNALHNDEEKAISFLVVWAVCVAIWSVNRASFDHMGHANRQICCK